MEASLQAQDGQLAGGCRSGAAQDGVCCLPGSRPGALWAGVTSGSEAASPEFTLDSDRRSNQTGDPLPGLELKSRDKVRNICVNMKLLYVCAYLKSEQDVFIMKLEPSVSKKKA